MVIKKSVDFRGPLAVSDSLNFSKFNLINLIRNYTW